ncbi:MAG: hypothetical protein LBJ84_03505 [Oscillospiraceae bacterium]|jgi:hypothetical protein|nr:hypothetical protein [Oscillospiraceae bacterium]
MSSIQLQPDAARAILGELNNLNREQYDGFNKLNQLINAASGAWSGDIADAVNLRLANTQKYAVNITEMMNRYLGALDTAIRELEAADRSAAESTRQAAAAAGAVVGGAVGATGINSRSDVYLTQNTAVSCTLASMAMMLRRRALLDGRADWSSVTESSIKPTVWDKYGYANWINNNVAGYATDSMETSNLQNVANLLKDHPEGIEAYFYIKGTKKQHAVLITDYRGGQFYCADPYSKYSGGEIPLSGSLIADLGLLGQLKRICFVE